MIRRENAIVSGLFLAAVFCASFDKVHWAAAGTVYLADVVSILFLVAWAIDRLAAPVHRVPRTVAVLIVFFFAFLLVYLVGFFNLDTQDALDQFGKGIVKWAIHFVFLIVAVAYIARRSRRYYWRTLTPILLRESRRMYSAQGSADSGALWTTAPSRSSARSAAVTAARSGLVGRARNVTSTSFSADGSKPVSMRPNGSGTTFRDAAVATPISRRSGSFQRSG